MVPARARSRRRGWCCGPVPQPTGRRTGAPSSRSRCVATSAVRSTTHEAEKRRDEVRSKGCVAVERDGVVVGFLLLGFYRSGDFEMSFSFLPEHQRKGYAREAASTVRRVGIRGLQPSASDRRGHPAGERRVLSHCSTSSTGPKSTTSSSSASAGDVRTAESPPGIASQPSATSGAHRVLLRVRTRCADAMVTAWHPLAPRAGRQTAPLRDQHHRMLSSPLTSANRPVLAATCSEVPYPCDESGVFGNPSSTHEVV